MLLAAVGLVEPGEDGGRGAVLGVPGEHGLEQGGFLQGLGRFQSQPEAVIPVHLLVERAEGLEVARLDQGLLQTHVQVHLQVAHPLAVPQHLHLAGEHSPCRAGDLVADLVEEQGFIRREPRRLAQHAESCGQVHGNPLGAWLSRLWTGGAITETIRP